MIEISCTCDGLPPHSHLFRPVKVGNRVTMVPDEYDVRIWVDWREIAKDFSRNL